VIHHLIVGAGAAPAIITGSQAAPAARVAIPGGSAFYERTIEPIVDTDYGNRKGYIDDLLGIRVPLPKVIDPGVVSRMDTGECVLPYQHFSVVMHKTRRLALFTASNVTALKRLKEPEPDQDYTRRGLGGFGEDDTERWLTDPRIPELHQLPDTFYNRDRKSFDKGHIVRREDVCWGTTYAEVRRANGDTYHTTNCSPQVKAFNRPSAGGVWGKLENYILTQAKSESYAVFAGPVFAEDDEWFEGVDKRGPIRVQIPRAYWKVIVARGERGLETFAFLLTQDLSSVVMEDEFSVSASWAEHVVPVDELQGQLQGLKFATAIRRADQSQTMPV
jgi:endonuclease G